MFNWLRSKLGLSSAPTATPKASAGEAYRLGRNERPNEHFRPNAYSGDQAILQAQDLMTRRVRDMRRNAAQAKAITSAMVDLVVGVGFKTFAWPFLPDEMFQVLGELESIKTGELGPRLQYALESDDLFEEWSNDPSQFDAEGRQSRSMLERMLMAECVTAGNGLLIRTAPRRYKMVPLAYQIIEREQLDAGRDRMASTSENAIVGGVEVDAANRVVAYWVLAEHPQEVARIQTESVRIPAERVIDLALFDRPSSTLGASWFDATGQTTFDRASYCDSEIRSAAVDAAYVFVAKLKDGQKYGAWGFADGTGVDDDAYGNREYKLGYSPYAATIGTDEELDLHRPARPNKDAASFLRVLDRDTARAFGISPYTITGDYEKTNFSSSRAAKLDEDQHIATLQQWFGTLVSMRIRREFNAVAAAMGLFRSITPAEFAGNERRYQRFEAYGPSRDLLDPYKEGEARTARLRTGVATFKEECAKRNQHWIRVLSQIAIEKRTMEMLDVSLDWTGGGALQATEAAAEAAAGNQTTEAADAQQTE